MENIQVVEVVWGLVVSALVLVGGLITWAVKFRSGISGEISKSNIKARENLEDHGTRLTRVEQKIEQITGHVNDLPGEREISKIHVDIERQNGKLTVLNERMNSIATSISRIERSLEK